MRALFLKTQSIKNKKWFFYILRAIFALIISYILTEFPLESFEAFTYDSRVKLAPTSPTSGQIQTILINQGTFKKYQGLPNSELFAESLEIISNQKPKFIVSLLKPQDLEGSPEQVQKLVETTKKLTNFYLIASKYPLKGDEKSLILPEPFDHLNYELGRIVRDNSGAKDSVTRRQIVSFHNRETIHAKLGREFSEPEKVYRGQFKRFNSQHTYIKYHPKGTYKPIIFENLIEGKSELHSLKDKLVIIGAETLSHEKYYSKTPYSQELLAMTNLEIHANMFDTMILNNSIMRAPHWTSIFSTSLIAVFTVHIVLAANPAIGLLTIIITFFSFSLIAYVLLAFFSIWIGMIHPFLAIFICYYFSIPYRLIMENRRSWEYYQKHKLLTQVEELKTNFLSMMSHDIKTPIARIHGMADILLSKKENLSEEQVQSALTVRESVEELSEFISTILDLGRIENQKVKLKLKPKDINQLLEEVIKKHSFLAQRKNIEIFFEPEPLFSIQIDIELIRQVLANLVENAIKYSPQGSKILISTEETKNSVIIQVADQGQGISKDEVNNIFMKFYRTKLVNSTQIKGSGLGLYLAQYFVKLHKGSISVESALNQGSTFTVELPVV